MLKNLYALRSFKFWVAMFCSSKIIMIAISFICLDFKQFSNSNYFVQSELWINFFTFMFMTFFNPTLS